MAQPALYLFAKQPVPGRVKTRLQPDYTPEAAAAIAEALIRETVELAISCWPGPIYLCAAPDPEHPVFTDLSQSYAIELLPQGEGDLGARMQRALAHGIALHEAAAVMGSDIPHCPWEVLDEANALLARGHNVIGPTEDGGYYFLGLTAPHPELFTDIVWGGPEVLATTLRRAADEGIEFAPLPTLRDIDTAADLWLVAQRYEPLQRFL
jgi:uncharacterized protein